MSERERPFRSGSPGIGSRKRGLRWPDRELPAGPMVCKKIAVVARTDEGIIVVYGGELLARFKFQDDTNAQDWANGFNAGIAHRERESLHLEGCTFPGDHEGPCDVG